MSKLELLIKSEDGWFVSKPFRQNEDGDCVLHINYPEDNNKVVIEQTIDEDLGWQPIASYNAGKVFEINITGIANGQIIRFRTDYAPSQTCIIGEPALSLSIDAGTLVVSGGIENGIVTLSGGTISNGTLTI